MRVQRVKHGMTGFKDIPAVLENWKTDFENYITKLDKEIDQFQENAIYLKIHRTNLILYRINILHYVLKTHQRHQFC